ncbi:MAG: glutamate formimidoyltransferase [Deltaproteobacteria bacterium]|nr:glutamate formimidoyltransferase [Deltaproteobacteria bacterium]
MKIIECVPNFSEGRDKKKVDGIANVLLKMPRINLLDYSMDADHNRSVFTFAGPPDAVRQGAMAACDQALAVIDMRIHNGVHPRIGAVDIVPFIPLAEVKMNDAIDVAHQFGRDLAEKHHVPVYFYGDAAIVLQRKELSVIRRGGYENFKEKMKDPLWIPDAGPSIFNEMSGASAVGARIQLIAFNINLKTSDLNLAKAIARSIRESGGGLQYVKAMGVPLKSRNVVQVSMNLTDYRQTSMRAVFDEVTKKASEQGVEVLEAELIGLAPRAAFKDTTSDYLRLSNFSEEKILETHF